MAKKMFLVEITHGEYEDKFEIPLFVTRSENKAKKYVKKAKKLLEKLMDFYSSKRYEDEVFENKFDDARDIKEILYYEIEVR